MIWVTSDTHFGHRNVLYYDHRPWATIEEHDAALVDNWNALVRPSDLVYHLGDFSLCRPTYAAAIAARLNGQKFWIRGNHDSRQTVKQCAPHFVKVADYEELTVASRKVVLMHYPILSWRAMHHGSVMLHGHSHGNLRPSPAHRVDVGIMNWGYHPVGLGEAVLAALAKRGEVVDGHV